MSAANDVRLRLGLFFLTSGSILIAISYLSDALIFGLAYLLGIAFLTCGIFTSLPVSIINGVVAFLRLVGRSAEPKWDGEILHTDGSFFKIRYLYNDSGSPCFMASDVCIAVGQKAPNALTMKWGGGELIKINEQQFFTEFGVQDYLVVLAIGNSDATRLLTLIRNNVLRKVEKERHLNRIHG